MEPGLAKTIFTTNSILRQHSTILQNASKSCTSTYSVLDENDLYGVVIDGQINQVIQPGTDCIGVWVDGNPTWAWYVGSWGVVQWIYSDKERPGRIEGDPEHISRRVCAGNLPLVEFILVQGEGPNKSFAIWEMNSLKAILRVGPAKERSAKTCAPPGWSMMSKQVSHSELGRVTTGVFRCWVATPPDSVVFQFVKSTGLSNTLGQVLSSVVKCSQFTHKPEPGNENTGKGLLKWDLWFNRVIVLNF